MSRHLLCKAPLTLVFSLLFSFVRLPRLACRKRLIPTLPQRFKLTNTLRNIRSSAQQHPHTRSAALPGVMHLPSRGTYHVCGAARTVPREMHE